MKYWAYVNNEILGPFEKDKLRELPSFSASLLVCPQTPVGEKTEDWKEASTYPELAALTGGAAQPAPQPEPAPQAAAPEPEPAPQSFPQPAIETPNIAFKPLTAAQPVDPVPPSTHTDGMADISVSRLGRAGGPSPAPEPVAQSSSGFDPISLSQIVRRTENHPAQEAPAQPEGLSLEPRTSPAAPEPAPAAEPLPEIPAFTPAAEPPPAEQPAAAVQQPGQPAAQDGAPFSFDTAGLQNLIQRLDQLAQTSATRKDIDSAVDPIRFKLDQMGEVISSIKNSQFQREVMEKLGYLENAVGELKEALRGGAAAPAPAKLQEVTIERNSDTVFGVQSAPAPKKEEKPKPEPAKEAPVQEPKDQGSKKSNIGSALKKVFRLLATLLLLAAVLVGTVIFLKNFGIFDATKFIPFPLPFTGSAQAPQQAPAADPFSGESGQAAEQPQGGQPQEGQAQEGQPQEGQPQEQLTPEQQAEMRRASQEQAQRAQDRGNPSIPPEAVPEVIYITRTYKLKPAGQSLENKIYEHAGKAGGNYNRTNWEVTAADGGKFNINALIPAKGTNLVYTFLVDRNAKSVVPSNDPAKEAFAALSAPPARTTLRPAKKKAAPRPAPKPKSAPKKAPAEDEEYEYVYVDEDEEGAE